MGSNLDRMKKAVAEQPAIAVPTVTVPEKKEKPPKWVAKADLPVAETVATVPTVFPKKPRPPKPHRYVMHGRLPHGSQFHGVYTHTGPGELDGYWDVTLTVPGIEPFTIRAAAWFKACSKLDGMYRATLEKS